MKASRDVLPRHAACPTEAGSCVRQVLQLIQAVALGPALPFCTGPAGAPSAPALAWPARSASLPAQLRPRPAWVQGNGVPRLPGCAPLTAAGAQPLARGQGSSQPSSRAIMGAVPAHCWPRQQALGGGLGARSFVPSWPAMWRGTDGLVNNPCCRRLTIGAVHPGGTAGPAAPPEPAPASAASPATGAGAAAAVGAAGAAGDASGDAPRGALLAPAPAAAAASGPASSETITWSISSLSSAPRLGAPRPLRALGALHPQQGSTLDV